TLVQLVGIDPLGRWVARGGPARRCTPAACAVTQIGGARLAKAPREAGVPLRLAGRGRLISAAPLGYAPGARALHGPSPALLVTGDAAGLEQLPALSGTYRTNAWLAGLDVGALHAWDLRAERRRLSRAATGLSLRGY